LPKNIGLVAFSKHGPNIRARSGDYGKAEVP
jgi:hypothetical protein